MKKTLLLIFLSFSIISFYHINQANYDKHKEIEYNFIAHPELLPKKEIAKNTSFGFKNIRADLYRIQAIQYVGGSVIGSQYKKYLYNMLDLITELNPYFENPYIIGELLLPSYDQKYENIEEQEKISHIKQGEKIGLKGIKNLCSEEKIKAIGEEEDLEKIWTEKKYSNPCKSYKIPFYLAYLYYFYLDNPTESSKYYKVASAIDDAPIGAKSMSAVMTSKSGDRQKSIYMFLSLAKSMEGGACEDLTNNIESNIYQALSNGINERFLYDMQELNNKIISNDELENGLGETRCTRYITKAIREINMLYLDEINEKYLKDFGQNTENAEELIDKGYINFLPIESYDGYNMIYYFDVEKNRFDIKREKR